MYLFLPVKKFLRVFWSRSFSSRRERPPSSLQHCLEADKDRKGHYRRWFILFLVTPILYYTFAVGVRFQHLAVPKRPRFYVLKESNIELPIETTSATLKDDVKLNNTTEFVQKTNHSVDVRTSGFKHKRATTTHKPKRSKLPLCRLNISQFGPFSILKYNLTDVQYRHDFVKMGGYFAPLTCQSRHKVGILVPYRNRETNLAVFLFNIHPFLMNQNLEYRIFVIEQYGKELFNKGRLFNAGFIEMQKYGDWNCVVLHDVDLLPLDSRIMYTCPTYPRHMCTVVANYSERPNYNERSFGGRPAFGGVSSMSMEHFKKVNGFSNLFWGWGGEDTNMFWRVRYSGLPVVEYDKRIAKYYALPHDREHTKNPYRRQLVSNLWRKKTDDGLSTVEYKVVSVTQRHLYTHIVVDVNPYRENITELVERWSGINPVLKLPPISMNTELPKMTVNRTDPNEILMN